MTEARARLLNVAFDNVTFEDVVREVERHVECGVPGYMVSLNADMVVKADRDPAFALAFGSADLVLMDSQPLTEIARARGVGVAEKLSGSDLLPRLCGAAADRGWSVFFLGGAEGVPERAAANMRSRFPALRVAGTLSPAYGFEREGDSLDAVVAAVREASPDVLFVCLGAPKSELLCFGCGAEMGVPFSFCVGAAVDFAAGTKERAPRWASDHSLEWLWRFAHEPRRLFRRYFVDSWRLLAIAAREGVA